MGCLLGASSLGVATFWCRTPRSPRNSKFETGFPCCYEVIFVKIGEQNILSSTLLARLTLSEYLVSGSGGFHLCCCPGLGNIRRGSSGVPMGT